MLHYNHLSATFARPEGITRILGRRKDEPGESVQPNLRQIYLKMEGVHCQGCASTIEYSLRRGKGVVKVKVNYREAKASILYDPAVTGEETILQSHVFKEPSQFKAQIVDG